MKKLIYQAGPLFSAADKAWHQQLSKKLAQAGHEVIWPGNLLSDADIISAGAGASRLIFKSCKDALDRCCAANQARAGTACVLALLDGAQVDDGTAWEIGYAHAKGLPVYGIRTDSRQAGDTRFNSVNSMIECALAALAFNEQDLLLRLDE